MHVNVCMCVYTWVIVCVSIHIYSHICVCEYVYVWVCVCTCEHTYMQSSPCEDEGQRAALRSWFFPATLWALSSNSSSQTCTQLLLSPCQASSVAPIVGSWFFSQVVSDLRAVVLVFLSRSFGLGLSFLHLSFYVLSLLYLIHSFHIYIVTPFTCCMNVFWV